MRKIVIHCETGQVGTDSWDFVEVPDTYTIEDIDNLAQNYALDNAEMYGIYPPDYENEDYPDDEDLSDDISGMWVYYDPKLHDGYTQNGVPDWYEL